MYFSSSDELRPDPTLPSRGSHGAVSTSDMSCENLRDFEEDADSLLQERLSTCSTDTDYYSVVSGDGSEPEEPGDQEEVYEGFEEDLEHIDKGTSERLIDPTLLKTVNYSETSQNVKIENISTYNGEINYSNADISYPEAGKDPSENTTYDNEETEGSVNKEDSDEITKEQSVNSISNSYKYESVNKADSVGREGTEEEFEFLLLRIAEKS